MTPSFLSPLGPIASGLNAARSSAVAGVEAITATRPGQGLGAGQSFSDDPFGRMLEQSRHDARLQARRAQERETPKPAEADPEPQAATAPAGSARTPAAAGAADAARQTEAASRSDKPAPALADERAAARQAANAPPRRGAAAEARPATAPVDPMPGGEASDPALPGTTGTTGHTGPTRALVDGPIECPAAPLQALEPAHTADDAKRTVDLQRAAAEAMAVQAADEPGAMEAALETAAAAADEAAVPLAPAAGATPLSSTPAASSSGATATSAATPARSAAGSEASLSARPDSESFGLQLSHQVTLWLRQGITEARLHLNPAELGPVQIAISLDGQAAQVRLAAEQLHTRQALELALPTLAGSLAEAGFTLAGGGVFDQAPQPSPQPAPAYAGAAPRGPDAGAPASERGAGLPAPAARGLVDLLA